MPTPLIKHKIVKKRTKKFIRFQSDLFARVKPAWRKPKGIDNRVRRQYRGSRPLPRIGFGSDKTTKYIHPDGFKHFTINNVDELEILLMHNRSYAAEIAHGVGAKKRVQIIERAKELDVKVVNNKARIILQENE